MMKLYHLPIIHSFVHFINTNLRSHTLPQTMKSVVRRSCSKIDIYGLTPQIQKILDQSPGIIIANHPHDAEVISILSALPDHRDDVSLITNYRMTEVSSAFDRYCIP